jgi:CBS-domain-containing membrane protein
MENTVFERPSLDLETPESNIARTDTWIADTADKLNFLTNSILKTFTKVTAQSDTDRASVAENVATIEQEIQDLNDLMQQASQDLQDQLDTDREDIEELQESFPAGCRTIAQALTAKGVQTADNASPETIAENIAELYDLAFEAGKAAATVPDAEFTITGDTGMIDYTRTTQHSQFIQWRQRTSASVRLIAKVVDGAITLQHKNASSSIVTGYYQRFDYYDGWDTQVDPLPLNTSGLTIRKV